MQASRRTVEPDRPWESRSSRYCAIPSGISATDFQVPAGVLTMVAMTEILLADSALYRICIRMPEDCQEGVCNFLFYLVGPLGFEPRTKGL